MIYLIQRYIVKHTDSHPCCLHAYKPAVPSTPPTPRLELKRLYDIGFTEYHRCLAIISFETLESYRYLLNS